MGMRGPVETLAKVRLYPLALWAVLRASEARVSTYAPADTDAGAGNPDTHRALVQREPEAAEGRDRHRVRLRRVVDVAVVPEPEVDLQALAGADAFEEAFDVAPHRQGQILPAAHLAEDGGGFVVVAEGEQRQGIFELDAVISTDDHRRGSPGVARPARSARPRSRLARRQGGWRSYRHPRGGLHGAAEELAGRDAGFAPRAAPSA